MIDGMNDAMPWEYTLPLSSCITLSRELKEEKYKEQRREFCYWRQRF